MFAALNNFSTTATVDLSLLPAIEHVRPKAASSAVSFEPNWEWERYLDRLPEEGVGITSQHVATFREFWKGLNVRLQARLPLPVTQPTDSGAIQLAWNRGSYCVEIDLYQDGSYDWFFRDRKCNVIDGNPNSRASGLPKRFVERLRLVARE